MNDKSVTDMIDFGSLFGDIISQLWWALPLLLLPALFRSSSFKGLMSKALMDLSARFFLDKNVYHLIKNVTLPAGGGSSTRIDYIIVSRYGLFVIETKNMKGLISGGENQKVWMQQTYKSRHKFQNPLHQNHERTKILQARLGLESDKVFSIVVFIGNTVFATRMPDNVTYGSGYIRYIKSKTKLLLSETKVQQIIHRISEGRLAPSIRTHIQHANHVQNCMEPAQAAEKESAKVCPECGSDMILLTVKVGPEPGGQFWSCSTFPKCRAVAESE
jgi:hypothetical protein